MTPSTNDAKALLRAYLDDEARRIHSTPPGLNRPPVRRLRRTWPVLAAAAVLIAVAVPIGIRSLADDRPGPPPSGDRTSPPPAGPPCQQPEPTPPSLPTKPRGGDPQTDEWAGKMPAGPPPRKAYTRTRANGAGHLQDGDLRVPLAAGRQTWLIGRAACGWLVERSAARMAQVDEVGVITPAGEFRRLGKQNGWGRPALSPDGTKVAFPAAGTNRILVVDAASGRQLDSVPTSSTKTSTVGWNQAGLWYLEPAAAGNTLQLWQPGSSPRRMAEQVESAQAQRTSDRILIDRHGDTGACFQVAEAGPDGALRELMRNCSQQPGAILSPDGKLLARYDGRVYRVPENTPTELEVPGNPATPGQGAPLEGWDDAGHVLAGLSIGTNNAQGRRILMRCDVVTGACERILDDDRTDELDFAGG